MAEGQGPQQPKLSILDFFSAKPAEKIFVKRGQTDGRSVQDNKFYPRETPKSKKTSGKEYVEEFRKLQLEENSNELDLPQSPMKMPEEPVRQVPEKSVVGIEGLSTLGASRTAFEVDGEELTDVYSKYDFTPVQPKGLHIEKSKDKILRMVESNQVVVIEGATGCGKSTQVPQYILDQHASRNLPCNIVVTQPRRLAATSIAKWVCKDRGWELGKIVGYQIGLDRKIDPDTRLLFCTTGVLLEKLISMKEMNKFTHVILDEVHERTQDMDFLMLLVRKLLRTNSKNVKVILMSATFQTQRYANYFATQVNKALVDAPLVSLSPGGKYRVTEFFLDDLHRLGSLPAVDFADPRVTREGIGVCHTLLLAFENMDKKDFENEHGRSPTERDHYRHCVLIFLPGLRDIEEAYNELYGEDNVNKWHLLPLHSTLTRDEQQKVFEPVRPALRKVVLCTDIAESSLTVPDVKYVIDFCLTKELVADPVSNFISLQLRWASRTNSKQRAGRTGRVMNGRVYRLVPKSFYYDAMQEDKEAEMLRCPLEIVVLKCKILDIGEPRAVLSLALDPPDVSNIERSILLLKESGALLSTCRGVFKRFDGDITYLGRVMASLPLNYQISKFIVLGHLFSLLEETTIIAAMLSVQNVFTTPFREQIKAYDAKLLWADGSCSDAVAYLNCFLVWKNYEKTGYFKSEVRSESKFCNRHYINAKGLREANELVTEITARLKDKNIVSDSIDGAAGWSQDLKPLVLKTLIAGAFYPNYFFRGEQGGQINERDALKKVGGHDSRRSIYLMGMPPEQPGMLYARLLKEQLRNCGGSMKVYYEGGKYIVEFDRSDKERTEAIGPLSGNKTIPGGINMAVYRAVKRRVSKLPVTIRTMALKKAKELAESHGLNEVPLLLGNYGARTRENCNLPGPEVEDLEFAVSEVQDPGRFWIQLVAHRAAIERLFHALNAEDNRSPLNAYVRIGDVVAAPFEGLYYRAKICDVNNMTREARVFFVDYGSTETVGQDSLRVIREVPIALWNSPPYAIEARLCGVAPAFLMNKNNIWSAEATELFRAISKGLLRGKVYSVVDNVVTLYDVTNSTTDGTLEAYLISKQFAEEAIEDIRSKDSHDARKRMAEVLVRDEESARAQRRDHAGCEERAEAKSLPNFSSSTAEVDLPEHYIGKDEVLKGPFSPLEMQVFGCMRSTLSKQIRIDPNSVNSVLLDANPEDVHERLLVGAVVTQPGETRGYLSVRNTTLMPNIHGLPALMALLFAPTAELRTNAGETKLTSMLCGLGCDPKDGTPLFSDNDLSMTFDTVIDEDDLDKVNNIRLWMSHLLHTDEGETLPSISVGDRRQGQLKLKDHLIKCLMKKRASQKLHFDERPYEWRKSNQDRMMTPETDDCRYVFRLIRKPVLTTTTDQLVQSMQELLDIMNSQIPDDAPVNAKCTVCDVKLGSKREIAKHVNLESHRQRENLIYGPNDEEGET